MNFKDKSFELEVSAPKVSLLSSQIDVLYTLTNKTSEEMVANYRIDDSPQFFIAGTSSQLLNLLPGVATMVSIKAIPLRVGKLRLPNLKLINPDTGKIVLEHEKATSVLVEH